MQTAMRRVPPINANLIFRFNFWPRGFEIGSRKMWKTYNQIPMLIRWPQNPWPNNRAQFGSQNALASFSNRWGNQCGNICTRRPKIVKFMIITDKNKTSMSLNRTPKRQQSRPMSDIDEMRGWHLVRLGFGLGRVMQLGQKYANQTCSTAQHRSLCTLKKISPISVGVGRDRRFKDHCYPIGVFKC